MTEVKRPKRTVKMSVGDNKASLLKNPYGWFDTRLGAITAIAASFLFIAIFISNIIVNHTWVSGIFVILYGVIILNRLKLPISVFIQNIVLITVFE